MWARWATLTLAKGAQFAPVMFRGDARIWENPAVTEGDLCVEQAVCSGFRPILPVKVSFRRISNTL